MLHILVVDDNEMDLELVSLHLRRVAKYLEVDEAPNAIEAIQKIEKTKYDCIVCDYQMPYMNGLDFLIKLRNSGCDIPFIFFTGQGSEEVAAEALRCGASDYFVKGVSVAMYKRLLYAIERAVDSYQQRVEHEITLQVLRESEGKYRSLFNNLKDVVFVVGSISMIVDINPFAGELFGYSKAQLLNMKFSELFKNPADWRKFKRAVVKAGYVHDYPSELVRNDGSALHVTITSNIERGPDEGSEFFKGTIRDVTKRKEAETALQVLTEELRERIKELNCLIALSNLMAESNRSRSYILKRAAALIPPAMKYQKLCSARIVVGNEEFRTPRFKISRRRIRNKIVVDGQAAGFVEVCYGKNSKGVYEGDFLPEEEELIVSFAQSLSSYLEQRAAEESLRKSEEKYRSLFEKSEDAIFISSKSGRLLDINPSGIELFGYSKKELLSINMERLYANSADRGRYVREAESMDYTVDYPTTYKRKDGSLVHALTTSRIVRDVKGKVIGYEGIIHDITELKKAEEALRESEERFRSFFENVPAGLYRTTPDGRILLASPELLRLMGYETFDELAKVNLEKKNQFMADYSRETFKKRLEREGEIKNLVSQWKTRNNETIYVNECSRAIRNDKGEIVYYEGSMEDITAKTLAEEALKESEAKYRNLIETATDGVVIIQDSRIKYANARFAEMIGRPGDKIMETEFCLHVDTPHIPGVLEHLGNESPERVPRSIFETVLSAANGTKLFAELGAGSITYAGKPAVLLFIRDVTERKCLEIQLANAQRLEAIGQLAAGIAHEINSPTQFINDNTHYLRTAFAKFSRFFDKCADLQEAFSRGAVTPEQVRELMEIAERDNLKSTLAEIPQAIQDSLEGIERVTNIVQAMKQFAHPGTEKRYVDLNQAITSTITVAKNEWKYVADMATDFDDNLPPVPCFPGEFNQAILNLIINSVQAIQEAVGEGSTEKGRIMISTKKQGEWAEIRISDTGTGIPEEIRDKIFNPFFTTKEVGRGTGQGLAIVHDVVVNKLGGSITLDSEVGKGATFTLRLPLNA